MKCGPFVTVSYPRPSWELGESNNMTGCRKGKRDCVYPPPTKPGSRMNPKPGEFHPTAHETELSDNNEVGDSGGLGVILDDEDGEQASRSSSTVNSDKTRSIISRKQGVQSPPKQRTKNAENPSIC